MSLPEAPLLYLSERDIDLLVLEEMIVSSSFRQWFATEVGLDVVDAAHFVGAWHSVWDAAFGESDLIALWRLSDERRHALLIENKINAPAQPSQGERYSERGQNGVESGDWDEFRTCIMAPARYLESSSEAKIYQAQISYEQIRDWFLSKFENDRRALHRARVVESAIEQQRRGYSPEIDEGVSQFWHDFWQLSLDCCPRIGMDCPAPKPIGSGWIWTRPPELGDGRWLAFKLLQGIVDLQVDGAGDRAEEIDAVCVERLDGDVRAVRTGKSTSLRIEVAREHVRTALLRHLRDKLTYDAETDHRHGVVRLDLCHPHAFKRHRHKYAERRRCVRDVRRNHQRSRHQSADARGGDIRV